MRVVSAFAAAHPECQDGDQVRDKCSVYSREFAAYLAFFHLEASVINGFEMEGNVILKGHTCTLAYDRVFDWTLRQFDPTAHVPTITPLAVWRETWRSL